MIRFTCLIVLITTFINSPLLSQWEQTSFSGKWMLEMITLEDKVLAGDFNQIYESVDNGLNWDSLSTINSATIDVFVLVNRTLFVGLTRSCNLICPAVPSIFRSVDFGATWEAVHSSQLGTSQIQPHKNFIFANFVDVIPALLRSSDDGVTWQEVPGFRNSIVSIAANSHSVFISLHQDSLFVSHDEGTSWKAIGKGLPNSTKWSLVALGDTLFTIVSTDSIYRSTDNGETWMLAQKGIPNTAKVSSLYLFGDYIYTTSTNNKVYATNVSQINWVDRSDGLEIETTFGITDLAQNRDFIFVSTSNGIWRRPVSQVVSVNNASPLSQSNKFRLLQNHPNPFNAQTQIVFYLRNAASVEITIFNINGQKVKAFNLGQIPSGEHTVLFNGNDLPTGLYVYRLSSGRFIESKKMLIIK